MPGSAPVSQTDSAISRDTNTDSDTSSADVLPNTRTTTNSPQPILPISEVRRSSVPSYDYPQPSLAPPISISPSTSRRASFNVYTTASFLSPTSQNQRPPRPRHNTQLSLPRMMTTMNMASRLAGGRVKDQTIHHSFSDRSSTHTKPATSQDTKGLRMAGYSADGLKRISNGIGREWSEKVAPCVSFVRVFELMG